MKLKIKSKDNLVHDVIKKFDKRSKVGFEKYGATLADDSDSLYRWVNDVQEELMDAILYLQKVKQTLTELVEEDYIQDMKLGIEGTPAITHPEYSVMQDPNDYWTETISTKLSDYPG